MASLRLVCPPSSSYFPTKHQFFSPTSSLSSLIKIPQLHAPSLSALCSLSLSTERPNLSLFRTQFAVETTQLETPANEVEQQEDEVVEEEDEGSRTRLFVQNIPWTCTADDIRPLFEQYGTVVDIELVMHNKTRNCGLAFVSMSSHTEALAALSNLETYEFMDRTIRLSWAKPKKVKKSSSPVEPRPVPTHNLFVANLPFQARSKDLMEFFNAENANAVSAEVIFHQNPRASAGYGFVSFNTKEEAEAALSALQGKKLMGRPIRVAPSRRFLRQSTKLSLQSEAQSSKSEMVAEQAQAADEADS